MSNVPVFPGRYIIEPSSTHKYTLIALHGLGSTGRIFADRLLFGAPYQENASEPDPEQASSRQFAPWTQRLPLHNIRFVFPTAPTRHLTIPHDRDVPAWFQVSSFTDLEYKQEEQMAGLTESVGFLSALIDEEVRLLEAAGRSSRDLFLLGRSQGSSVTGWTFLTAVSKFQIGGIVLAGSWLIFARALREVLGQVREGKNENSMLAGVEDRPVPLEALDFARSMVNASNLDEASDDGEVPILMGHSTDDKWISVKLGRQFRDVVRSAGCQVEWREYVGAEEEGHWLKDPEEFDAISDFLLRQMKS
ncbi:alpha/beta-hydrolase [Lojkania enalia]|uniref:Alpha/beta-hydrolase n=1 Tax=Lojkania enalia TaxID=147567 RepID=A0A9P4K151_9PLEO|nr:alpha/beta-hydrolase [Didymosphaeria enalia]